LVAEVNVFPRFSANAVGQIGADPGFHRDLAKPYRISEGEWVRVEGAALRPQ
jgi:hypothetical protein